MGRLFIEDLELKGQRVLLRADFNVPLDDALKIVDATRIQATLRSIRYVLAQGGTLILMSHLGRPKNAPNPRLSLQPVAKFLSGILGQPVVLAPDCVGSAVRALVHALKPGDILMLENLRFHRAEEYPDEDPQFAKEIASYGDCYVNDAFGTAHRKHSSTYSVPRCFPKKAAAGYLMAQEIEALSALLAHPTSPFYAVLGGAKISSKLGILRTLLQRAEKVLVGGAMAFTLLKAQGYSIGSSLYEEECLPLARELLQDSLGRLLLPRDLVIATVCSENAAVRIVSVEEGIPQGYQGLDIGPRTREFFCAELRHAKTILWNGPVGVYEMTPFAVGTRTLAHCIAELPGVTTIVGGGDTLAVLAAEDLTSQITHISTGGGATLEFLEKGTLPGIEALSPGVGLTSL